MPGYAANGTTYKDALSNAEVVIREWIETARELGRPIPEPKGAGCMRKGLNKGYARDAQGTRARDGSRWADSREST